MAKTATQREEDYKREVDIYLRTVQLTRNWSQSELARQAGVRSTTINKALKLKHALGYPTLMALAERSGIPLTEGLITAAKSLRDVAPSDPVSEAEAFLQSSPAWRRMVELGRKLAAESDPKRKQQIKEELEALIQKVA